METPGAEAPRSKPKERASQVKCRRREYQITEVAEGDGCGRGCPPPHTTGEGNNGGWVWEGGCAPSLAIFFRFLSSNSEFWCTGQQPSGLGGG